MKIGTDGVLLASWVDVSNCHSVLDIGAGSGVISLIIAQRSKSKIHALEIDHSAFEQCQENFENSPWPNQLSAEHQNFNSYTSDCQFDLIISNPPFYTETSESPVEGRKIARHSSNLHWKQILVQSKNILSNQGRIALILPYNQLHELLDNIKECGGYVKRICDVITKKGKSPKRLMIEIVFFKSNEVKEQIIIEEGGRHEYSKTYIELTKDFYLHL